MILAERLFVNLDRPPNERLGLGVAREVFVGEREVIQCRGNFQGAGTKLGSGES
jgi:hypothetical protein